MVSDHHSDVVTTVEAFAKLWTQAGETLDEPTFTTAWRRYQYVNSTEYNCSPETKHPTLAQLTNHFDSILEDVRLSAIETTSTYLTLNANTIPWTPTGIVIVDDQPISVFAVGRTWRSKLLDLYLPPQFNLWYRIGTNGPIFNSTHSTRSFKCVDGQGGELYIANQFPGAFQEVDGGRVAGKLSVYEQAEGQFHIGVIQWPVGTYIDSLKDIMQTMFEVSKQIRDDPDPDGIMSAAIARLSSQYYVNQFPVGWKLLWFLGVSMIFTIENDAEKGERSVETPVSDVDAVPQEDKSSPTQNKGLMRRPTIRCFPNHNVGILQKDIAPFFPLQSGTTTTWRWNTLALPSRLREDTAISHDYLSIAFEFENGRDLTYTWSWELPVGFGYWCPLSAWCDREYHIVVRSGTELLGKWLEEKRNIFEDYVTYINDSDHSRPVPTQIIRVWLIAGNRWQRHKGEMLIKEIELFDSTEDNNSIAVL